MAGSFGILFFVLFVGAANLALGYAAAVYFGKARLHLVWVTFTLPSLNPLDWLPRGEERTAAHAAEPHYAAPSPQAEMAYSPPTAYAPPAESPPAAQDMHFERPRTPEPRVDAGLEASLSAYSAAARDVLPTDEAEDFGPTEPSSAPEGNALEGWAVEASPEAPSTEDGLSALLDDLVAQNVSELQGAFARIDQAQTSAPPAAATSAQPAKEAGPPIREAITIP
jgi:hypothetical protein